MEKKPENQEEELGKKNPHLIFPVIFLNMLPGNKKNV